MRAFVLIAVLTTACGEAAGAGSNRDVTMTTPAITPIEDLIGEWTLADEEASCRIELVRSHHPRAAAEAPEWRVARPQADCAPRFARLTGWYPAPLGLVLTDEEGAALLIFEMTGSETFAASGGTTTVLRRAR